jgi:uncharacterized membrane protein YdjX (TVP38/TMEM64 family)
MAAPRARRWIAPLLALAALVLLGRVLPFREWLGAFTGWIDGLGPAGMALYAAAYVLVTVLMLPAWLMTIGAGLVFGFLPGVAVVWAGATAGAAASFLIARYFARDRVARAAEGNPKFRALDQAIGEKGWKIVLLLRMSIVVPYVFSNYVYGLTAIRFWPYLAASAVGMVPVIALYVALGVAAGRAEGVVADSSPGPWIIAALAVGFLITAGVTYYVARLTRRALGSASLEEGRGGERPAV